jgi:hypothetical protein
MIKKHSTQSNDNLLLNSIEPSNFNMYPFLKSFALVVRSKTDQGKSVSYVFIESNEAII